MTWVLSFSVELPVNLEPEHTAQNAGFVWSNEKVTRVHMVSEILVQTCLLI